jgi:hypothetical protein
VSGGRPALRRARWTDAFGIADPARQEFERPDFAMGGGIVEVVALPLLHCALGEENPNQRAQMQRLDRRPSLRPLHTSDLQEAKYTNGDPNAGKSRCSARSSFLRLTPDMGRKRGPAPPKRVVMVAQTSPRSTSACNHLTATPSHLAPTVSAAIRSP